LFSEKSGMIHIYPNSPATGGAILDFGCKLTKYSEMKAGEGPKL